VKKEAPGKKPGKPGKATKATAKTPVKKAAEKRGKK
jgi:hypothetical protein